MLDQVRPVALLLARVAVGVVFIVHGYQKFAVMGLDGATAFFDKVGVPLPGIAAPAVAVLEVAGGLAFIVGAALPIAGVLLAADMVGAILFVHLPNGFMVGDGGYEFVLSLAAAALAIGFSGGGLLSVDALRRQRRGAPAPA
ncbi:DoxX family protein [Nonomuraea longicatena]|uniref:DoxX family protein n=1 Tax=Nonomuraea longicatena TaxID=83682 RepID=A0ABP4A9B1_9ACTN